MSLLVECEDNKLGNFKSTFSQSHNLVRPYLQHQGKITNSNSSQEVKEIYNSITPRPEKLGTPSMRRNDVSGR